MMSSLDRPASKRTDAGFSLVELIMAVVVLALGVVGLAGTTLNIMRQLTLAEATTARAAAHQSVIERMRALPFDSLAAGSDTIGPFTVSWTVVGSTGQTRSLRIVTVGPGQTFASGGSLMLSSSVADTLTYRALRP